MAEINTVNGLPVSDAARKLSEELLGLPPYKPESETPQAPAKPAKPKRPNPNLLVKVPIEEIRSGTPSK